MRWTTPTAVADLARSVSRSSHPARPGAATRTKAQWSVRARRRGRDHRETDGPSPLADRWTTVDGTRVFFRESRTLPMAPARVHLHGFAMSGRYLLPTAERLATTFHTPVPDLPG